MEVEEIFRVIEVDKEAHIDDHEEVSVEEDIVEITVEHIEETIGIRIFNQIRMISLVMNVERKAI